MMYVGSIVAMTSVSPGSSLDFIGAFSTVVACINNAGPTSTFAGLSDFQTRALSFTMLLGRRELFTCGFWQA